jgi:hypothetical protein
MASAGYGMIGAGDGRMRASTADRERAIDVLKAGFSEGRLSKDEYDERVSQAYAARTYSDLAMITADLPGGQMAAPYPAPFLPVPRRTNSMAVASLVCGLAQPFTVGLTTLPAVILGHMAHGQIRRTGEEGNALATVGLVLGWLGIGFAVLLIIALAGAFNAAHPAPPTAP